MRRLRHFGRLALDHRRSEIESAFEENRTVLHRENHRLFRGKAEALLGGIEGDISVGRLGESPLAHVALGQPGACRKFARTCRTLAMQRIEQSEPVPDPDGRHTEGAAEITQHFSDKRVELIAIEFSHCSPLQSGH
jgi:hypothetical protein